MSQFEYIAIPVSLIITFGIARLLSGFPYVLIRGRGYWIHTLWLVTAIINLLFFWWGFWMASDTQHWTLGTYLWALFYPGMCYIGALILVPTDVSEETEWREHFFKVRRLWFAVAAIATLQGLVSLVMIESQPLLSLESSVSVGFIGLYILAYSRSDEVTQTIVVLLNALAVMGAYAPLIYQPIGQS